MYSQHKHLAAAWEHLQGHHDVSAILREIIGHHALQGVFQDDDSDLSNDSFEALIWIKILYDLQRCYLGGTSTGASHISSEATKWLLPPDLLFSSIIYLINVKVRVFSSETTLMTKEFTRPRLILAQTVLSGLRLLLLQQDQISAHQRRSLRIALNEAWRNDDLQGVECCIIKQVFAAALDVINDPHHVDAYRTERENARLPTYTSSLYPLDIRPEIAITPLIHALAEEDDDWIDAYFVLYDALWAVECAITQRYIDLSRQHETNDLSLSVVESDEIIEQLYQQRSSVIVSAFHIKGPMVPSDTIMESLVINLLDWDPSLDSFLSRQDSHMQHRMSLPRVPARNPNYGKRITKLQPYFGSATQSFALWLSNRRAKEGPPSTSRTPQSLGPSHSTIVTWISRMACANSTLHSQHLEGPQVTIYMVDCPKLHAVPKLYLAEQLRWVDKWAYQGIQEDTPILNWKEGVQCPSCPPGEKIKCARLLEPLHGPPALTQALEQDVPHDVLNDANHWSRESSNSHIAATSSTASYSVSEGLSAGHSFPGHSTMNLSVPTTVSETRSDPGISKSSEAHPPQYTESPVSPMTLPHTTRSFGSSMPDFLVSPLVESFDVPISMSSRLSMNLPIPVHTSSSIFEDPSLSVGFDSTNTRLGSSPSSLTWSPETHAKSKASGRSSRIASSMRRKPTVKDKGAATLPKETFFTFSSSGGSLLLWSKEGDHVSRFDVAEDDIIHSCRYGASCIEAVAAGHRKCAVMVAKSTSSRTLKVFDGLDPNSNSEFELGVSGRAHGICMAFSKDDKYLAVSINDQIDLFRLENGLKLMTFHHQMDVYELRGGVSHRRSIPVTRTTSDDSITESEKAESGSWFTSQTKALNFTEAAEEQQRQTAIISRKVYFSTDSQRLIAATQLGDHCVYIDVWDVTREPVSTISEHSRSFKLPPWVLNDGDITGVFYDSAQRAALVTAFIGKEYPVLIPFPGYDPLQNETYSTKIISAAQSPSGLTFIVANSMTEIIQFEYTAKGRLSPRKLKKASSKISNGVFKPGAIALAMPSESTLLAFWIKDGKCMLRTIKLGITETIRDVDIRLHYDRLMDMKDKPIVGRAPSLNIPELDAGDLM
ncbi:hypothetical protein CC86DRAFT_467125 [Ophiobolus disseminans]|uniref:WD40 repeat-like protein n=1 Tax=Ophiobolus disseminans TaxID=1469910 RepID=A0A6A7A0V2_9PLEO|nr:hypothetical protein CC86DRAFT_467125 [Ophiobolus disseminans]